MKWILPIIFLCCFYAIPAAAMWLTGIKDVVCSMRNRDIVAIFALSVVFLSVIFALISREKYIYFWDYGGYWYQTLTFQDSLSSGFMEVLKSIITSIQNDDYNILACAVIAFPLKVFNNSYFAFVILNTVLFYIPNAFLMAFTFLKILEKYTVHPIKITWIYAYTLLVSVALFPVLNGYIDIIGMIPLTAAYLLVINRDFERPEIRKDILLGVSFLWVVCLRRYYAYAVVGGAVFAFLFWSTYGATRKNPFYRIKTKLVDTLAAISVPVIVLVVFFREFLVRSLFNNHSYAYSAYKATDYLGAWSEFGQHFGILFIVLMILGITCNIRGDIGKMVIGLLAGLITSCTLFFRIQNMGHQHYYITVFPMYCLIFLGLHVLFVRPISCGQNQIVLQYKDMIRIAVSRQELISYLMKGIAMLVVIGNFLMSIGVGTGFKNSLWESYSFTPKIRHDFAAINSLDACLKDLHNEGYSGVYCLGSSGILNSDLLYKLNAPDPWPQYPVHTSDIDLRDGFQTIFFAYDIIVACDPVQTHTAHGQEVIIKLNEVMLTDNIYSENYVLKDAFVLDGGVHAYVYVKQEPLDAADIEYIRDMFNEIYPDYPELFADRINAYLSENYSGDL